MATFRERSKGTIQVSIRSGGVSPTYRSFPSMSEAQEWARVMEADPKCLRALLHTYRDRGLTKSRRPLSKSDIFLIGKVLKIGPVNLLHSAIGDIKAKDLLQWRDERLQSVSPQTFKKELDMLHRAIKFSIEELGDEDIGYLPKINIPSGRPRERRAYSKAEILALLRATRIAGGYTEKTRKVVRAIIILGYYRGMRRGEMGNIKVGDIDTDRMTLQIPETKTGYPRTIPLDWRTLKAATYLSNTYFNIYVLSRWFREMREVSGIPDGDIHCLRHSFLTWTAERGLTPQQISAVSGHRTLAMVARYTHLKGESIRDLL